MKFQLSTLLLFLALLAVLISWQLERRSYLKQYQNTVGEACAVKSALAAAGFMNKIYAEQENLSPVAYDEQRVVTLHLNIAGLFENPDDCSFGPTTLGKYQMTRLEYDQTLEQAGKSLALLSLLDLDLYSKRCVEMFSDTELEVLLLSDDRSTLSPRYAEFIENAIVSDPEASY